MLLSAAIVLAIAALAAALRGRLALRASRAELRAAASRLAIIDADTPRLPADGEQEVGRQALRRDHRASFAEREGVQDRAVLAQLLADYRDVAGAEEAIFWRWSPERNALFPVAWSSDADLPAYFDMTEWAPLIQWSAETLAVQTVGHDDVVNVGAVVVERDGDVMGVLSLTHRHGLGLARPALKEWLPRLAKQLGTFQALVNVRKRYARYMRQGQALLDAVQRLQGDMSGDGLPRAL